MAPEVAILLFGGLLLAMAATLVEMRTSLRAPRCPECAHCRRIADEERLREERELARLDERILEYRRHDDEDRRPRR